ncbi:hypothetical protein WD019_16055 [Fictibacillus sp. Mic-4]|uniref:hypothetical protein n=1 Tax=Fictibacillus sp. Mic-4 TaxID=3132826 RepID=UPI003CF95679
MKRVKFEHIFAFAIIALLAGSLYVFRGDKETVYLIIGVLVNALGAITAYFFTKHNPSKSESNDK